MASKYWIKLYHEVLHDPKMGTMPDHLWRRAIEMMLIAGDADMGGYLPTIGDMAWTLRCDESELTNDIDRLMERGLLTQDEDRLIVTNFAQRQGNTSSAVRMARLREKAHKDGYYGDEKRDDCAQDGVTEQCQPSHTDIDIDIDKDIDVDVDIDADVEPGDHDGGNLTAYFWPKLENAVGLIPVHQIELYKAMVEDIERDVGPDQQRQFVDSLFHECAMHTRGRASPAWFQKVIDSAIREQRLPGDKRLGNETRASPGDASKEDWSAVAKEWGA